MHVQQDAASISLEVKTGAQFKYLETEGDVNRRIKDVDGFNLADIY